MASCRPSSLVTPLMSRFGPLKWHFFWDTLLLAALFTSCIAHDAQPSEADRLRSQLMSNLNNLQVVSPQGNFLYIVLGNVSYRLRLAADTVDNEAGTLNLYPVQTLGQPQQIPWLASLQSYLKQGLRMAHLVYSDKNNAFVSLVSHLQHTLAYLGVNKAPHESTLTEEFSILSDGIGGREDSNYVIWPNSVWHRGAVYERGGSLLLNIPVQSGTLNEGERKDVGFRWLKEKEWSNALFFRTANHGGGQTPLDESQYAPLSFPVFGFIFGDTIHIWEVRRKRIFLVPTPSAQYKKLETNEGGEDSSRQSFTVPIRWHYVGEYFTVTVLKVDPDGSGPFLGIFPNITVALIVAGFFAFFICLFTGMIVFRVQTKKGKKPRKRTKGLIYRIGKNGKSFSQFSVQKGKTLNVSRSTSKMIGGVWASRSPSTGSPISGVVVAGGKMVKPNQTPVLAFTPPLMSGRGVSNSKSITTNPTSSNQKRRNTVTHVRPSTGTTCTPYLVAGGGVYSTKSIATNATSPNPKRSSALSNARPSIGTTCTRDKSSTL